MHSFTIHYITFFSGAPDPPPWPPPPPPGGEGGGRPAGGRPGGGIGGTTKESNIVKRLLAFFFLFEEAIYLFDVLFCLRVHLNYFRFHQWSQFLFYDICLGSECVYIVDPTH